MEIISNVVVRMILLGVVLIAIAGCANAPDVMFPALSPRPAGPTNAQQRAAYCKIAAATGQPIQLDEKRLRDAVMRLGKADAAELIRPAVSSAHAHKCLCAEGEERMRISPACPARSVD